MKTKNRKFLPLLILPLIVFAIIAYFSNTLYKATHTKDDYCRDTVDYKVYIVKLCFFDPANPDPDKPNQSLSFNPLKKDDQESEIKNLEVFYKPLWGGRVMVSDFKRDNNQIINTLIKPVRGTTFVGININKSIYTQIYKLDCVQDICTINGRFVVPYGSLLFRANRSFNFYTITQKELDYNSLSEYLRITSEKYFNGGSLFEVANDDEPHTNYYKISVSFKNPPLVDKRFTFDSFYNNYIENLISTCKTLDREQLGYFPITDGNNHGTDANTANTIWFNLLRSGKYNPEDKCDFATIDNYKIILPDKYNLFDNKIVSYESGQSSIIFDPKKHSLKTITSLFYSKNNNKFYFFEYSTDDSYVAIYSIDTNGSNLKLVFRENYKIATSATISPNNLFVAFTAFDPGTHFDYGDDIYLLNMENGLITNLTAQDNIAGKPYYSFRHSFEWAEDSKTIKANYSFYESGSTRAHDGKAIIDIYSGKIEYVN